MKTSYIEEHFKVVEIKIALLAHHKANRSYTVTGYGKRIPTQYKLKINNRWYRLYCSTFSNVGSFYIRLKSGNYYLKYDSTVKQ